MERTHAITELVSAISSIKRSMQGHTYTCIDGTSLTSGQLGLLFAVKHHGPISAQDLAAKLSLTPGAISQLVESLHDGGYLERTARENDRRVFDLTLTKSGAKRVSDIEQKRHAIIDQATAELSDRDLKQLVDSIQKIQFAIQNEVKPTERK